MPTTCRITRRLRTAGALLSSPRPCRGGRGPRAAAGGVGWSIDLVAESAGAPPDPIPNSAVKPRRAHGTASQDVGE